MNTTQCKSFIFKFKDIMSLQPTHEIGMCSIWVNPKNLKRIVYKKWRVRYYPGKIFVFNGKGRYQHELFCFRFNDHIFGLGYRTRTRREYRRVNIFFEREVDIKKNYLYFYHYFNNNTIFLPTDTEEVQENAFSIIANDIEEALSVKTEEDFNNFISMIDLIGVQSL